MKVKHLLQKIHQLKADGLITNETELIYSKDDEWNSYHPVIAWPEPLYVDWPVSHYMDSDSVFSQEELPYPDKGHMSRVLCIN